MMGARLYDTRWFEPAGARQRKEIAEYEASLVHLAGFRIHCDPQGHPTHYEEIWEPGPFGRSMHPTGLGLMGDVGGQ